MVEVASMLALAVKWYNLINIVTVTSILVTAATIFSVVIMAYA